jgi:hypothetical protein
VGGFLGIGNSSAKTDRNQTLASYGQLNNLYNFGLNTGKSGLSAGTEAQGGAQSYFQSILSGNRSANLQAAAPTTNAVLSQGDASRRQQATMGTARGGGVASTNQTQKDTQMKQIDDALFGARGDAAKETAQIGSAETAQALQALGVAGGAAEANLEGSIKSRPDSQKINQQTVGEVTGVLQQAMMAFV